MKRSKLLLISGIIGSLYLIYLISYFMGASSSSDGAEAVGGAIATIIVMPHMIMVCLSVIFTWLAYGLRLRWAALVSGILYSVSILVMFIYAPFVIIQLVLSFVAFAKMKKPVAVIESPVGNVDEKTV